MHVIARRGVTTKNVPSNTLDAIGLAQAVNYIDGITLDVKLTKDEVLVVFEREEIDHLLNGKGNLSDMTLAELKPMNMGTKIHKQAISTLDEALATITKDYMVLLNIQDTYSRNKILIEKLVPILKKYEQLNIWLSSANLEILLLLEEAKVSIPLGLILTNILDYDLKQDFYFYVLPLNLVDATFIKDKLKLDKPIFIYPVNTQDEFTNLKTKLGDLIEDVYLITDRVKLLI